MPTEKSLQFLDHHLQPTMKQGESYIKDTGDFIEKLGEPENFLKGPSLLQQMWLGFIQVFHIMEAWKSFRNSTINLRTKSSPLKTS